MSILEAEADNTGSAADVTVDVVNHTRPEKVGIRSNTLVTPGLTFCEIEAVLDSQYSGSYVLYLQFSQRDREQGYRLYQDDNRISSVREDFVRLLSAGQPGRCPDLFATRVKL